jgi:predicted cobalt transporter CbtA
MRWTIDVVCVALIGLGIAILATRHQLLVRLLGTALVSLSVIVLLSNQKRFDRALKKVKRK